MSGKGSNPGTSGRPSSPNPSSRQITMDELKTHNTRKDAWMALGGKVFDVTDYVDKHPGGFSTIKQGFGTDATRMFNKVHSYVNFERALAGKQIGVLAKSYKGDNTLS